MQPEIPDTLVKLAGLGTSGICVLAIFVIAWILYKPDATQDAGRRKLLGFFMVLCLVFAMISAGTAYISNTRENDSLRKEIASLNETVDRYKEKCLRYNVKGRVGTDDELAPNCITITTQYPPLIPDSSGDIVNLLVRKDENGRFPRLSFTCPGYGMEGLDLNNEAEARLVANNEIEITPVVLHKLP